MSEPALGPDFEFKVLAECERRLALGDLVNARKAARLLRGLPPQARSTLERLVSLESSLAFSRRALTTTARARLRKEGYFVARRCAPAELVAAARRAVDTRFKAPPSDPSLVGRGGAYRSEFMTERSVMDLLYKTPAWALAEGLIGRGRAEPTSSAQVVLRPPEKRAAGPLGLHIDGVYGTRGALDLKQSSFTLLLCFLLNDWPGPFCGNFSVVPGSHLAVAARVRERGADALRDDFRELSFDEPTQIVGKAGDLVIAHYALVHDGHYNLSDRTRYAVFFRLKHVEHDARWPRALAEPWLEWEGLRA